jgi:hypothetical protein
VLYGNVQYVECDCERCPGCGGQLLSCGYTIDGAQYYKGVADTKGRRHNSPIWKMVKSSKCEHKSPTSKNLVSEITSSNMIILELLIRSRSLIADF